MEDDIYADTAQGKIPDPLKRDDIYGRVILCGSFSKSLSRDLRIGWISAGRWQANVIQLKLVTQLASPCGIQLGVAEFIENGGYATHLKRQQQRLNQQRDFLISEIRHRPLQKPPHVPGGGLTVWITLTQEINTTVLYQTLREKGVFITPGELFSGENLFSDCLRISFAHPWNEKRKQALKSLHSEIIAGTGNRN
ncbi:aminotransferase class I/II-fold pyridoxal phosphate-dependent enzyme [Thalassolituus maritimus]|uniref:aminotransferase class I/II-fold pyridoxal phosphate-dependent enzyme n=1 Tax=Thalassolituus maritimus TaxID=484498 RepID=UPI003340C7DE